MKKKNSSLIYCDNNYDFGVYDVNVEVYTLNSKTWYLLAHSWLILALLPIVF